MKNELKKKIIICAATVVLSGIMLLVYFLGIAPKNIHQTFDPDAEKTVTLEIKYLGREYKYENLNAGGVNTVLELLEKYDDELNLGLEYETLELGVLVTGFKNTPQNTEKGYFYTYTMNGGYADGISVQGVQDGDVITFNYLWEVWEEIDGEWVLADSEFKAPHEPKTTLYYMLGIIAVIISAAVVYITVSVIKSKKGRNEEK